MPALCGAAVHQQIRFTLQVLAPDVHPPKQTTVCRSFASVGQLGPEPSGGELQSEPGQASSSLDPQSQDAYVGSGSHWK